MCHVNYLYFYVLFIQIIMCCTLLRNCYFYLYLWTNTFPVDVWRQIGCYKTTPPSPTMCNWRTDTINKMLSPISCDIFTFLEWCFPEVNIHLMFITWQSLFTTCVVWCINNLPDLKHPHKCSLTITKTEMHLGGRVVLWGWKHLLQIWTYEIFLKKNNQ